MRRAFIIGAIALLAFVQPARTQSASPESTAAAKELVETMRATDQLKALIPMVLQQFKSTIVQGRAEVERDYDALAPQMLTLFDGRMGEFATLMANIYATYFSADELRQLTAFYRTPVGEKLLLVMPKIAKDSMSAGSKIGEQVGAEAYQRMREELRKRGHKI